MAATVQMNTRIDPMLKQQGDAVLERFGMTPAQAVRALWTRLSDDGALPDCLKDPQGKGGPSTDAAYGFGLAARLAQEAGLAAFPRSMDYKALRGLAFEEQLADDPYLGA